MGEIKNLLVVDDEEDITLSIINYIKKHIPELKTLAAFDGNKALQIIKSTKVDILITDIRMPGASGIDLILELKKINPEAKAIVITAFGSELIRKKSEHAGALHYVEKPFRLSHLCTLIKKIIEEEEEGFKGNVSQLQLVDVLQMLCINKRTMVVDVKNKEKKGKIYILNGEIIHCECETKKGREACFEILSWKNGEFNLSPLNQPSEIERTVNESWMSLFMESMKEIDEVTIKNENETAQKRTKIREIITSVFQKVDGLETNIVFNIEKGKPVFNGDIDEKDYPDERIKDYSSLLKKFGEAILKNENEELNEVVVIAESSLLIFMKISKHLVWTVKISGIENFGIARAVLEKSRKKLIDELRELA